MRHAVLQMGKDREVGMGLLSFFGLARTSELSAMSAKLDLLSDTVDGLSRELDKMRHKTVDASAEIKKVSSMAAHAVTRVSMLEGRKNNGTDDGTASSMVADKWRPGVEYKIGMLARNEGRLFCCVETHTSGNSFDEGRWGACTVSDVIVGLADATSDALRQRV